MTNNSSSLHLVGIGGIGMSGLAQLLKSEGYQVTGSDRGLDLPENKRIFDSLRKQGIGLYPQDGSYLNDCSPNAIIYSSAIEEDNPDFTVASEIKKIHRAEALATAIQQLSPEDTIAVSGSCGKTTVTAWLAETLFLLNKSPMLLAGGLAHRHVTADLAGNFWPGNGKLVVFEADESDKSLLGYSPDYALLLNVGTDHYPHQELVDMFRQFLANVRKGVVIQAGLLDVIGSESIAHLEVKTFSESSESSSADWSFSDYNVDTDGIRFRVNDNDTLHLPMPGRHNASNALAVLAMLDLLGNIDLDEAVRAVSDFQGVWRRFDLAGETSCGAKVYDDYAHNVEKIVSVIQSAKEMLAESNRLLIFFQPHGFGPLKFMKEKLFEALEQTLSPSDIFSFLPVFYAGGTTSFTPSSEDVCNEYVRNGKKNYRTFGEREQAEELIREIIQAGDIILILGARDNSLSDWALRIVSEI